MSENQQVEWKLSWRREYYYRSGSTKQVLKGAALDRFLLGKTGRQWDAVPVPGELPANWSEEKLLGPHPSQPFNPDIANAFFRAGDTEAWGRGIERVFDACRQASGPQPRIHVEPGDFWFEFRFSPAYLASLAAENGRPGLGEATQETRERTREKILRLIRERPAITTKELAEEIGITAKGIEWQLSRLKAGGMIRRIGADRGGRWEVLEDVHE